MTDTAAEHTLVLERRLDAPPAKVWRAWTEPELLKQWFCPLPWRVTEAQIDPRPGGVFANTMQGPNGETQSGEGVFLEADAPERLIWTDSFRPGWIPNAQPFMTAVVTFTADGDGTLYRAEVRHASAEASRQHEEMGFHAGWGAAADQLNALVKTL